MADRYPRSRSPSPDRYSRSRSRNSFSNRHSQYADSLHSRSRSPYLASTSRSRSSRLSHSGSTKKTGDSRAEMDVYGDILRKLQFEELDESSRQRIEELGLSPLRSASCSSHLSRSRSLSRPLRDHNGPFWLESYHESSFKMERATARAIFQCPWFEEH